MRAQVLFVQVTKAVKVAGVQKTLCYHLYVYSLVPNGEQSHYTDRWQILFRKTILRKKIT